MVELGIALTHGLPDKTRSILLKEAACLAAAVSPKQALAAHASIRDKHEGPDNPVDPLPGDRFPLDWVNNFAAAGKYDATRSDLLRCATHAWREPEQGRSRLRHRLRGQAIVSLFVRNWRLLPHEEAVSTLHEIVRWLLHLPERAS
jgi:hypothetical protein